MIYLIQNKFKNFFISRIKKYLVIFIILKYLPLRVILFIKIKSIIVT